MIKVIGCLSADEVKKAEETYADDVKKNNARKRRWTILTFSVFAALIALVVATLFFEISDYWKSVICIALLIVTIVWFIWTANKETHFSDEVQRPIAYDYFIKTSGKNVLDVAFHKDAFVFQYWLDLTLESDGIVSKVSIKKRRVPRLIL